MAAGVAQPVAGPSQAGPGKRDRVAAVPVAAVPAEL